MPRLDGGWADGSSFTDPRGRAPPSDRQLRILISVPRRRCSSLGPVRITLEPPKLADVDDVLLPPRPATDLRREPSAPEPGLASAREPANSLASRRYDETPAYR